MFIEEKLNLKYKKVIVWGYPLHTHTQSYTHAMWHRVFRHLGFSSFWFDDENYPKDFDYSNSIFITEGWGDKNIPVNDSSIYFVNFGINPKKYLDRGAKFVDIRLNVDHINDLNYSYELDRNKTEKLGECAFFLKNANDSAISEQFRTGVENYSAVYLSWATDKLPHEFNFDDRFISRENVCFYIGSVGENNVNQIMLFNKALQEFGVPLYHVDPWKSPVSFEDAIKLTQRSFIAPDIRGSFLRKNVNGKPDTGVDHKKIGYIPCRTFKNISYGQVGATNSKAVKDLFGELILYSDNEYEMAYMAKEKSKDYDYVLEQMKYVQANHTFVNRAEALLQVIERIQ